MTVVYRLTNHQGRPSLVVEMSASLRSGQATPINLAQHTYWNLAGHKGGSVMDHEIRIFADRYTPVNGDLIPTGALRGRALRGAARRGKQAGPRSVGAVQGSHMLFVPSGASF